MSPASEPWAIRESLHIDQGVGREVDDMISNTAKLHLPYAVQTKGNRPLAAQKARSPAARTWLFHCTQTLQGLRNHG